MPRALRNGGPDCVPDEYSLVSYGPCKLHFLYPSCLIKIVSAFMETEENEGQRYKNSIVSAKIARFDTWE